MRTKTTKENYTPGRLLARLKIKKKKKSLKKIKKKQKKKTYRSFGPQAFFTDEYRHFSRSMRSNEITPNTDLIIKSISSFISFGKINGLGVDILKNLTFNIHITFIFNTIQILT